MSRRCRLASERGVVLVQVLVLSVILASIAMMLIQWQYGRYVLAYRLENSNRRRDIAEAVLQQKLAEWSGLASAGPGGQITVPDPSLGPVTVNVNFGTCQPAPPYQVAVCVDTD